jgi:toxin ParE1/3/4
MSSYELSRAAVADLLEIAHYTHKTWGPIQAQRYRDELDLALQRLALAPERGRNREEIAPGMRSSPVAAHIAFYVQHRRKIIILRILHPRMDVDEVFAKGE